MLNEELVWTIPKKIVDDFLNHQKGLIEISFEQSLQLLKHGSFIPKSKAEQNEELLQVIPYFATSYTSNLIMQRRTKVAGEQRLYNKLAFFGGHINSHDNITNNPTDTFWRGAMREFNEELDAKPLVFDFLGLIRLDTTPVDKVHLGFAFYIRLGDFKDIKEKEKYTLEIIPLEEATNYLQQMETWAFLCTRKIIEKNEKNKRGITPHRG